MARRVAAEDGFNSDNYDETRAAACGDYDETGGGGEDDFNSYSDYERACTYIGNTNVALAGEGQET